MDEQTWNDLRATLIELREYIICHELNIGESNAWGDLKKQFMVGQDRKTELLWLREHKPNSHVNTMASTYAALQR